MTTIFLIRGFRLGSTAADDDFSVVRSALEHDGYKVVGTDWTWNHMTMSKYAARFKEFYNQNKTSKNIVIGHSFGAYIAFMTAPETEPDLTMLCSLSACFKEDLPYYQGHEEPINRAGKRRMNDFSNISANTIAGQINDKNLKLSILYGEKEKQQHPLLVRRCRLTAKAITNTSLREIKDADHSIFSDHYIAAIQKELHNSSLQ